MGDTAYTIVATIFFALSIGFTLKTLAAIKTEDWTMFNTGVWVTGFCWTLTALFAGWV